ncbi:glycosidase [Hypnocyclicus thermotrophus]|uniref:Glycosidase n=1 Tax=Hypnocyclicus thermotrophus TaxID=1627895 RepID=A0AA46I630_9FUSO|nr:glycoside hydrolase family 13 protein [Hypnocyclicus thermotrophus]TDT71581.1 glycosidase [Hypnocyclicus thermotrophus]
MSINKFAVYHKAKSNFAYLTTDNKVHIKIKCAKNDADNVYLIFGDKYEWHKKQKIKMKKISTDNEFDYYGIKVFIDSKRLSYYFEIEKHHKIYSYTNFGFFDNIKQDEAYLFVFHFPYLHFEEKNNTPTWVKNAIFYQIFPERFEIGNPEYKDYVNAKWEEKPKYNSFHGGDLRGIINRLDYLKELGITALYFTPIFKAPSNHKYDTIDYMEIDPHFGTKKDFKELIKKAHSFGIKIILDAVFNHTGDKFFAFQDILKNQENSKYKDWYYIKKFPIDLEYLEKKRKEKGWKDWYIDEKTGKNILPYETFAHTQHMPKLNLFNKDAKEYILNAVKYWTKEFNIDGWRLDVADEVPQSFWKEFRKVVRDINKDAYIVGEIWSNSENWLNGDQFDAVMNYGVTYLCTQYFAENRINSIEFLEGINSLLMKYQEQTNFSMLNLLDSHDTARFLNKCNFNEEKHLLALTFIMTYIGAPMIYYGTEIGMDGEHDPDCRKGMIWNKNKWNMKYYNYIKRLIRIRKENIELQEGEFIPHFNKKLLSFERIYKNNKILVIINNSKKEIRYKLENNYTQELITNKIIKKEIILQPYQAAILK